MLHYRSPSSSFSFSPVSKSYVDVVHSGNQQLMENELRKFIAVWPKVPMYIHKLINGNCWQKNAPELK